MMGKKFLLGCDWGTSAFRLRLYNLVAQNVSGEMHTPEGVAPTFNSWNTVDENDAVSQEQYFRIKLREQVKVLANQLHMNLDHIPILISGMASSSIGMQSVNYANLPFALDGSSALTICIPPDDDFPHEIILVSGVKSNNDVMRGEETQVLGLFSLLKKQHRLPEKAILILPGTHSKHIYIQGNEMIDFQTFMTGEIFSLLSNHSILSDSVDKAVTHLHNNEDVEIFKKGIRLSADASMLHNLFSVRTNQLFGVFDKTQSSIYLSGLLIGSELRHLLTEDDLPILLCSSIHLHDFYTLGLAELNLLHRTTILSVEETDQITIAGQLIIMNYLKN
jgi:2-dehydro-3-deoxygalactonokinase